MNKETLQRKIESKLNGLEENLKYQIESQCELLSGIQILQYLLYMKEKEEN